MEHKADVYGFRWANLNSKSLKEFISPRDKVSPFHEVREKEIIALCLLCLLTVMGSQPHILNLPLHRKFTNHDSYNGIPILTQFLLERKPCHGQERNKMSDQNASMLLL